MGIKKKIRNRIKVLELKNEKLKSENKLGQRLINALRVNQNILKIQELKKLLK